MDITCTEITSEDTLEIHGIYPQPPSYLPIWTLDGLQYFTSLRYLDCSLNDVKQFTWPASPLLTYLDISTSGEGIYWDIPSLPNTITHLKCTNSYYNGFTNVPPLLKYLDCSGNSFSVLSELPAGLDTLICSSQRTFSPVTNVLATLPSLPSGLQYLDCYDNRLTALDLPASLKYLNCASQNYNTNPETDVRTLGALPTLPPGLTHLICSANKLLGLPDLPSTLIYLNCAGNKQIGDVVPNIGQIMEQGISELPSLPAGLTYLAFGGNQLRFLPVLPAALTYLNCGSNRYVYQDAVLDTGIDVLPALPLSLEYLDCSYNNLDCVPHIPASVLTLVVSNNNISCLPNSGNYSLSLPLCTVTNNVHGCQSSSVISGYAFYDNNSNGVKDPGENFRENVKILHSNGTATFTNSNGFYQMTADIGSNTLQVIAPDHYDAVPALFNYNISTYDSLITNLIALQPNVLMDSVKISLVPLNTARPGFDLNYIVNYENTGTTVVNPSIIMYYDNSSLTYNSGSNVAIINNGTSLSLSETGFTPGQKGSFTVNFTVNAAAVLGDTIFAKTMATANTNICVDSTYSVIRGSFDPNDKQATPKLTTTQVSSGDYINYIIRFQNTGTDTAFNVVLTDNLSGLLQANTFEMIKASHTCKVTQTGNLVTFEFLNIKLPYTGINEPLSHGFVSFRIKPQASAVNDLAIDNRASIYFDYNLPILTNIATTLINTAVVPLKLLSFTAKENIGNTALLTWSTANEYNTKLFGVEESSDGRNFRSIAAINAYGSGDRQYSYRTLLSAEIMYYRLKMIDLDGRFTYSTTVRIVSSKKTGGIVLMGNPVKKSLMIDVTDKNLANTNAFIINNLGVVVKTFLLKDGLQSVSVSDLAAATYFIKTKSGSQKIQISR